MKHHKRRILEDIDASPAPFSSFMFSSPAQIHLSTANNLNDNLSSLIETTDQTPSGQPNTSIDSTSFVFGGVVLLLAVCFVIFLSIYVHCFADDNPPDGIRGHQTLRGSCFGIDPKIIQSLPLFACDSNVKELDDCPICLTEFEEKELVKMIPFCGHFFHPQCIDMWLSAQGSCPLCRSTQLFRPLPSPPQLKAICDATSLPGSSRDVSLSISMESDAQQRQVFRPVPTPSSSASVTRANSFSSSTSSSVGVGDGDGDGVFSLRRSTSF